MIRYAGFIKLLHGDRDPWIDDRQIAEVTSMEAAAAVDRLYHPWKVHWWRGKVGGQFEPVRILAEGST